MLIEVPKCHTGRQDKNLLSQPPPGCIPLLPWSLSKSSVSFESLCSLDRMNLANGDKGVSFLVLHSVVHTKSHKSSCVKNERKACTLLHT